MTCPHDGDPYSCPPCQNKKNGTSGLGLLRASVPTPFEAMYETKCSECAGAIDPGEFIISIETGYVHITC